MIYVPLINLGQNKDQGGSFAKKAATSFQAKELNGQILSALDAFQKACEKFDYNRNPEQGEKRFRELAEKMADLFEMAQKQNETPKLFIKKAPVISNKYEISYDLRISDTDKPYPDSRWDYSLHALLKYTRDSVVLAHSSCSGKITVSAECHAPSLHWTTKINEASEDAFFDSLKIALMEVRNFNGDYATSPLFVKALDSERRQ